MTITVINSVLANLNTSLQSVTIALTVIDLLLSKIEDKLDKLFGFYEPPDPVTNPTVVIPDTGIIVPPDQIVGISKNNTGYQ